MEKFNFIEKIEKFSKENQLFDKGESIAIGISGGPDSVALFDFFLKIREKNNLNISLIHINHMLRGNESEEEEDMIKKIAEKNNVQCFIERVDIYQKSKELKLGVEETARITRYDFFKKIKEENNFNKIALAHVFDDNIETFLFRMIRGTSLKGLCSIPVKRDFYIRPMLGVKKAEVIEYLKSNEIEYKIDSSNLLTEYTRNKLRLELIPQISDEYNFNFVEKIGNLISDIQETYNFNKQKIFNDKFEDKEINLQKIRNYSDYEVKFIINEWLSSFGIEMNRQKVNGVLKLIKTNGEKQISLNIKYELVKTYDKLFVRERGIIDKINNYNEILYVGEEIKFNSYKIIFDIVSNYKMNVSKDEYYFDYNKLINKDYLTVRLRQNGDVFFPSGMKGKKKLKDYFIDEKVEKSKRNKIPIIEDSGNILWIAGHRGSEKYNIDNNTRKIAILRLEEEHNIE